MMADDQKPWHQPLTFEEICKSANNWSLAGDSSLFLLMEKISQDLIGKQSSIQNSLSSLQDRISSTSVKLSNTENKFNNFANYKFTENRVYDQDITKSDQPDGTKENGAGSEQSPKTREERMTEQMPLVREAINLGLKLMEEELAESSQETTSISQSYRGRRLPHLIGSEEYYTDPTLGCFAAPPVVTVEETAPVTASNGADGVIEDALGLLPEPGRDSRSNTMANGFVDSPVERRDSRAPPKSRDIFADSESESDRDLFSEDVEEKEESEEEVEEEAEEDSEEEEEDKPMSFADELNRRLGGQVKPKEVEKKKKKKEKAPAAATVENGSGRPPIIDEDEEEEDGLFSRRSLFTAGGSLFTEPDANEESEDEDLFSSKPTSKTTPTPQPAASAQRSAPPAKAVSSTTKSSDEKKNSKSNDKPEVAKPSKSPAFLTSTKGLFDSDDDDDIFTSRPISSTRVASKPAAPMFGGSDEDEDDDLFANTGRTTEVAAPASSRSANETQKHSAAPSTAKTWPVAAKASSAAAKKTISMFSDDDDDDDLFGGMKPKSAAPITPAATSKSETPKTSAPATKQAAAVPAATKKTVFNEDDDDDDDLFDLLSKPAAKQKKVEPPVAKESPQAILAREAAARRKRPSTSSESEAEASKPNIPPVQPSKPNIPTSSAASRTIDPFADDDDDDDDLFSALAKPKPAPEPQPEPEPEPVPETPPKRKLPPGAVPLFAGGFNPADALRQRGFSTTSNSSWSEKEDKPVVVKSEPKPKPVVPPAKLQKALISDDDEDDLFAPKPIVSKPTKATVEPKKPDPSPVISQPPAKTSAPAPKNDPFGFSDEDDDDLFAPRPATRPQPSLPARAPSPSSTEKVKVAKESSGGWTEDESLMKKGGSSHAQPPAKPVAGATADDSTTDAPEASHAPPPKPAGKKPPFGGVRMMGPALSEIKARVRHRRVDDSPEREEKSDDGQDVFVPRGPAMRTKPSQPAEPAPAADFSLPPKANTLANVTKSRARAGRGRRPPTRRHGASTSTTNSTVHNDPISEQSAEKSKLVTDPTDSPKPAADSPKPAADSPKPATDSPKPAADSPKPATDSLKPAADSPKPATDSPKPPADSPKPPADSPKPAADSPKPAADSPKPSPSPVNLTVDEPIYNVLESDEDSPKANRKSVEISASKPHTKADAAPVAKADEETKEKPPPLPDNSDDDELVSEKPKAEEDDFLSPMREKKPDLNKPVDDFFSDVSPATARRPPPDIDDDLFGDLNISKRPSSKVEKEEEKEEKKRTSKEAEFDDDIFASMTNNEPQKPEGTKKKKAVLLNDEDDLFASITGNDSTPKTQEKTKDKPVKKNEDEDIFDTDFSIGTKRGVATDDLFPDDTDIFSDIPATSGVRSKASKSKAKTKTTTKAKSPAKPVEQDDIDDIFAPTTSVSNESKSKKKSSKKTAIAGGEDIFDDPLNALQ